MDRSSPAYNHCAAVHLQGAIRVPGLERSLRTAVQRHETLRTTFDWVDGRLLQIVDPADECRIELTDLSGDPAPASSVRHIVDTAARAPYDLERGPLLRARLLRLADHQHVLCLSSHRIVCDGGSLQILLRELLELYGTPPRRRSHALPRLRIHYKDFAAWQNSWLASAASAPSRAFWHRRLGGRLPLLELPVDHPRPVVKTTRGRSLPVRLEAGIMAPFRLLCRRAGTGLFPGLVAAVKLLLYRYSGERILLVGAPVAGRDHPELRQQIGCYVDLLVLRDRLRPRESFRAFLGRVEQTVFAALAHRRYPFGRLVDELRVPRDTSRSPIVDVSVSFEQPPSREPAVPGVAIRQHGVRQETSELELSFDFVERGDDLDLTLRYNVDLFAEPRVRRAAAHLRQIVCRVVADPAAPAEEVELLAEAERFQLLVEWSGRRPPSLSPSTIYETFRRRARLQPDRPAIACEPAHVTYGELDRRARRLAHDLRQLGVGRETPVAVLTPRSPDMVVALLGILAAGGAYVPLEADLPEARLRWVLDDVGSSVLVTTKRLVATVPDGRWRPLLLDGATHDVAAPPAPVPDAGDVAYILYTSGSTGRPKGVLVSHRNAADMLIAMRENFSPSELERVLASTSITFDMSFVEIFAPLSVGGCVVLVENLLELPRQPSAAPTLVNTVPSVMSGLLRLHRLPASVRTVILGGEPLPAGLVGELYRGCRIERLVNGYGPTEACVYALFAEVPADGQVSIGRPPGGAEAYVLGPLLQSLPIGVEGELLLGGAGLARGYLKRPAQTAERFVAHRFSSEPGERLYRTGDLCRLRQDGSYRFLGRLDHQVKIRGHRIEPGEIEATLAAHPDVRDVVVVTQALCPDADRRLVAYVTPGAETPSAGVLRRFLERRLPAYMLPAAFVVLEELPRTSSGKVDRGALPEPEPPAPRAFVAPDSRLERIVAGVWRQVLGADRPGLHDNFFDLGGNSLTMIQVHSRLEELLDRELAMVKLFEHPTLAAIVRYLEPRSSPAERPETSRRRARARRRAIGRKRLLRRGQ